MRILVQMMKKMMTEEEDYDNMVSIMKRKTIRIMKTRA